MKLLLILLLLAAIPLLGHAQDTIKTKGVFVSVRKQNALKLYRFHPTTYIIFKAGKWFDDRGKAFRERLVFRMEENDQLIAFDGKK